jgi:putative oxidoreductase
MPGLSDLELEGRMTEEKRHDVGLLMLRVSLGITFIAHGYLKVFTFGIKHAMEVFEAHTIWHIHMIPGWFAPAAAVIEWTGGILLILGFKTRLITPFLAAVAFGAGAVHFENGWNYTSKPDGGWEYGIFLFLCCIVVYLVGPGKYTLTYFRDNR